MYIDPGDGPILGALHHRLRDVPGQGHEEALLPLRHALPDAAGGGRTAGNGAGRERPPRRHDHRGR